MKKRSARPSAHNALAAAAIDNELRRVVARALRLFDYVTGIERLMRPEHAARIEAASASFRAAVRALTCCCDLREPPCELGQPSRDSRYSLGRVRGYLEVARALFSPVFGSRHARKHCDAALVAVAELEAVLPATARRARAQEACSA